MNTNNEGVITRFREVWEKTMAPNKSLVEQFLLSELSRQREENILAMERYGENCKKDEIKRLVEKIVKKTKLTPIELEPEEEALVVAYNSVYNQAIDDLITLLTKNS
jgi:hypothetical protein